MLQWIEWAGVYWFLWPVKANIACINKIKLLIWAQLETVKPCLPKCSHSKANANACAPSRKMQLWKMHKHVNVCTVGGLKLMTTLHRVLMQCIQEKLGFRPLTHSVNKEKQNKTWWHTKPTRDGTHSGTSNGAVGLTHLGVERPPG